MDAKNSIQQLVNEVLSELEKEGYARNTVKTYHAIYMKLLAYANDNGIHEYCEAVGLDFMSFEFGFKLEGFFSELPEYASMALHHLLLLWHYQQYGTVKFITRRKKKPFTCPACFQEEYDVFLVYCEQKKYTIQGLRAILNPVQRFLAFLNTSQVHQPGSASRRHQSRPSFRIHIHLHRPFPSVCGHDHVLPADLFQVPA